MESAGQERWCRLRGNLLLYQKSAEAWSEPVGDLVLDVGDILLDRCSALVYCRFFAIN